LSIVAARVTRRVLQVALVLAAVLVVASFPASARAASTTNDRRSTDWLKYAEKRVCRALALPTVPEAAEQLIGMLAQKRIRAGSDLIAQFVVGSAQFFCESREKRAVKAVSQILSTQQPVGVTPLARYSEGLARQRAAEIAGRLRRLNPIWTLDTTGAVRRFVGRICRNMRRGPYPVWADLGRALPGADLDALAPVSGILSATTRCEPSLDAWQVGYLNNAAFNFLVANTYRSQDLEAPSVYLRQAYPVRYTDRITRVTVRWQGYDRLSGVSRYLLFVSVGGGSWQEVRERVTQTSAVVPVREGYSFQFALQAIDGRGNPSAWAYSGVGRT
jgi:hypothetical protein